MFCDSCGQKVVKHSSFCDSCGFRFQNTSTRASFSFLAPVRNHFGRLIVVFLLSLLVLGAYQSYAETRAQLRTTRTELTELRDDTLDAISSQESLIEEQGEQITGQQSALDESNARAQALRGELDSVRKSNVSNGGVNSSLVGELAPSIVQLYCFSDSRSNSYQQGTGMLYKDNSGGYYVRTNLHVVRTTDGSQSECYTVIYPNYQASYNYLVFESHGYRYYEVGIDVAFIIPKVYSGENAGTYSDLARYARNESASPICSEVHIGDHVAVLGYPGIGGDTLTVTDGIVSGFETSYGVRYVKTSAKIDHGNSGGIAILDSGCVIGIPTFVQSGIESIGRILDLKYLNDYTLR